MILAILVPQENIFNDIYSNNNVTVDREIYDCTLGNLEYAFRRQSQSERGRKITPRIDISEISRVFADSR